MRALSRYTTGFVLTTGRPDQLNLPNDPAFMPELDLNFDLSAFDMPLQASGRSSIMSPPSLISSRSSQQVAEEEIEDPVLELSSGDTSLGAGLAGFDLGFGAGISSIGRIPGPSVLGEETGIVDVGWEFDEHGNMIETAQAPKSPILGPSARDAAASHGPTDSAINALVGQEHAEGLHAAQPVSTPHVWKQLLTLSSRPDRDSILTMECLPSATMSTFFLKRDHSLLVNQHSPPHRCNNLRSPQQASQPKHEQNLQQYLRLIDVPASRSLLTLTRHQV